MSGSQTVLWLHVVGVTEQGIQALPPVQLDLLKKAKCIIGPQRLLDGVSSTTAKLSPWETPLAKMVEQVLTHRNTPTVILATGDPNWQGIGVTLAKHLSDNEYALHSAPSAFQLAAAYMRWPLQNVTTLSLHGRFAEHLHAHILPSNRIIALTSDATTTQHVAEILVARGYGKSVLTVMEHLGGLSQRVFSFEAHEISQQKIGAFYTLAIDCVSDEGVSLLPATPGLPDGAFISDGQLTKRDVRATTIAKLCPYPNAFLWDVGAGCGSVAIEWMRAARFAKAICFEKNAKRCEMIAQNKMALGTPDLKIVEGELPQTLDEQPRPHAVFIGGDVDNTVLFETCWAALLPQGRLVANAVTLEGEQALVVRQKQYGGTLTRLQVSVSDIIGTQAVMRPRMAVMQWDVTKGVSL